MIINSFFIELLDLITTDKLAVKHS